MDSKETGIVVTGFVVIFLGTLTFLYLTSKNKQQAAPIVIQQTPSAAATSTPESSMFSSSVMNFY